MRSQILLTVISFVVACGSARTQQPSVVPPPVVGVQPAPPIRTALPPTPPAERSVEDLLTTIENLRAQKAELDKVEAEMTAALRKKLQQQTERLEKLGIASKPAEPDRVGRIIIEGNEQTPEAQILKLLEFRPGQVLKYPALDQARAKLKKAGFGDITVEVIPNEQEGAFKDIRVRLNEKKSR